MKTRCKQVDILNLNFIIMCINDWISHRSTHQMNTHDVRNLFAENDNSISTLAKRLVSEMKNRKLELKPVRYDIRTDTSNNKERELTIQCAKQQIYDYIAFNALDDAVSYVGHYQIACQKEMGPIFGARVIQSWERQKCVRYVIKSDVRKCYQSITHENMIKWLRKHIGNDNLIWLISELLKTHKEGLPIGSYLSVRLSSLYMADLYHHIEGSYFTKRRGKKHNVFAHVMFNVDDIYVFGSDAKAMNRAFRKIVEKASSMGLEIKSTWRVISLSHNDRNAHLDALGYRIYRDRITMRRRNYIKLKQAIAKYERYPTVSHARSLIARHGMFVKNINSIRFSRKYGVRRILNKAKKKVSKYDKRNLLTEARFCPGM